MEALWTPHATDERESPPWTPPLLGKRDDDDLPGSPP
jgi:hypothetical protein